MSSEDISHPALLDDKVVFISGASRGIGAAAARLFVDEGAKVVLAARSTADLADLTAQLRDAGGTADYIECDLGEPESVRVAVRRAVDLHGRLDAAFNNAAAIQKPKAIDAMTEVEFDELYEVNLKAVWVAMVAEMQAIRETAETGAIVNNSSVGSLMGNPELPAYGAMKAGVNSLTWTGAVSWGPGGIRVNAIAPANVATDMITTWEQDSPGLTEKLEAAAPLRRMADPREVAEAAAWLLSDRASFVTGEVLRVDGGARA